MDTVGSLLGIKKPKQTGPSEAELAAQQKAREDADQQRADADRLAALAGRATSRRKALSFTEGKATLG